MSTETSSETFEWVHPNAALPELARLSGLEYMGAIKDGQIAPPPIASLMKLKVESVSAGQIVFECIPTEAHLSALGSVHGGLVCTLLDSALGCAAHTTLPAGTGYTSIDLQVSYLRPVHPSSAPLHATGRVVKSGSRVIFAEAFVNDAEGKLVASGTSSLLVVAPQARP